MVPSNFAIKREFLEPYGYSPGCSGCKAALCVGRRGREFQRCVDGGWMVFCMTMSG